MKTKTQFIGGTFDRLTVEFRGEHTKFGDYTLKHFGDRDFFVHKDMTQEAALAEVNKIRGEK